MKKKSQIKLINIFKWLRFEIKNCGGIPQNFPQKKTYLNSLNSKSLCCQRSHLRCLPAYGGLEMKTNTNTKIKIGMYIFACSFLTPKTYYTTGFKQTKNFPKKIGAKNDMYEFKKLCLGQKFRNDLRI